MIELRVNGVARKFDGDPDMPLLWYLRDELDLTGSKFGCGMGLCGACTVHVNGAAVRGCVTSLQNAAGKDITTIEGLSKGTRHPLQKAWKENNVPQCGYCQSGQIMQARAVEAKTQTDRPGYRRGHGGQYLPLRHLSAHSRRDQGCGGGERMKSRKRVPVVSRRGFLGHHFLRRRSGACGAPACKETFAAEVTPHQRPLVSDRLSRRAAGWHRNHPGASLGDGHGHSHRAAHGGGRRTRCRVEQSPHRAGSGRQEIWRPEYRWLQFDPQLLRSSENRRRHRESDADFSGGGEMGRSGRRVQGGQRVGNP